MATRYLSPTGSDSNSGTFGSPWFTLNKAWASLAAGDTIYMRGGLYAYPTQQYLEGRNGTILNPIHIFPFSDEVPIISQTDPWTPGNGGDPGIDNALVYFSGDYVYWKGIEITGHTQDDGYVWSPLRCQDFNYCTFELFNVHHNGGPVYMTATNAGATGNLVLNCDFHHHQDPITDPGTGSGDPYNNADGLNFENVPAFCTNIVKGCRAWNVSDDGFDFYNNEGLVIVDGCWAWNCGLDEYGVPVATGDGNGFKLGNSVAEWPTDSRIVRTVKNCLAWNNSNWGFTDNNSKLNMELYNNTAYNNGHGYEIYGTIPDWGQWCSGFHFCYANDDEHQNVGCPYYIKNNISFGNHESDAYLGCMDNVDHNSWSTTGWPSCDNVAVSSADFLSIDPTGTDDPRASDGSLPTLDFMRLAEGSALIGAGVVVEGVETDCEGKSWGLPPSLGAYEYGTALVEESSGTISGEEESSEAPYIFSNYKLKYQSICYNTPPFTKQINIQLYKKDYGVHPVINLRTAEVKMEVNYQDENTPIIGTGVKIIIINEGVFDSLEDLLTSLEKQFLCVITYDGTIVFQGFSICDLNEQQLLSKSRILLQFTDYLRRLDSDFLSCLEDAGKNTNLLTILHEVAEKVGLDFPLYVNSTLFETTMDQTSTDTFIEQTFIENNVLFSDTITYDDTYTAINKILKPFNAFLYSLGTKWVIERLDDTTRTGNWVLFYDIIQNSNAGTAGHSVTSLKKSYNKQAGDFKYIDQSQSVGYNSGLKTLIVDLKNKQLDTFVFNDYKVDMPTFSNFFPLPNTFDLRKWYIYYRNTAIKSGFAFRGMTNYFEWSCPVGYNYEYFGLFYAYQVTFNASEEKPTELSIGFKMSGALDLTPIKTVKVKFRIMIDGGPYSGWYLGHIDGPTGDLIPAPVNPNVSLAAFMTTLYETTFDVSLSGNKDKVWNISEIINLSDPIVVEQPYGMPPALAPSVWQQLGNPSTQRFVICFYPAVYITKGTPAITTIERFNYIGDVQVTVTQQEILNRLTYYINEDFIKTESVDMDFFDLENTNFSNGLMVDSQSSAVQEELVKTKEWVTYQYDTPVPLMDIFARVKFGNWCKTSHTLKATILCEKYLKPFSILSDNNLMIDTVILKFLLHGYTWDLINGTYDIEAVEYTDEATSDSQEDAAIITSGEIPAIPVGLTATQIGAGTSIRVAWPEVSGATGYRLSRRPYNYNGVAWVPWFKEIYNGPLLTFDDAVQSEGALTDNSMITYKVSAYNSNGESLGCPEVTTSWWN